MQTMFDDNVTLDTNFDELLDEVIDPQPTAGERLIRLADVARYAAGAGRASIFIHDAATRTLWTRTATDSDTIRVKDSAGIVGHCAMTRQITNVGDCYRDARFNRSVDTDTGYRTMSLLALPLLARDGTLLGVLELLNARSGSFDAEAVSTAMRVARFVAQSVEEDIQADRTKPQPKPQAKTA